MARPKTLLRDSSNGCAFIFNALVVSDDHRLWHRDRGRPSLLSRVSDVPLALQFLLFSGQVVCKVAGWLSAFSARDPQEHNRRCGCWVGLLGEISASILVAGHWSVLLDAKFKEAVGKG